MNLIKDLQFENNEITENEPLSKHTTFGIGGKAKIFININSLDSLCKTIKFLNENQVKYMVIGDGTNLLIADHDFDTVFIKLSGEFKKISYKDNYITCGAGVKLTELAKETLEKGYGGLERIGSIPGSIGGAVIMNAGVRDFDFSANLHSVSVVDLNGNTKNLLKAECGYSYRESIFQYTNEYVITHATLKLEKCDTAPLKEKLEASFIKRKATQPKGKCAGCFFKNSNNISSGKLIESCGLKGLNVNDAFVAQEHANFIMNKGNATCKDILELANKIKSEVKRQKGLDLIFEVRVID